MSANLYVTWEEFANWLDDAGASKLTDANGADRRVMFERLIEAASRSVDSDTGRIFYLQTATTRRYYPDPIGRVPVVDLLKTPTPTILVDTDGTGTPSTPLAATDYTLLPFTDDNSPTTSTRSTMIRPSRTSARLFVPGYPLDVTGSWGYVGPDGRAPAGIQTAVCIKAARLYMRRRAVLGRAVVLEAGLSEGLSKSDPDYWDAIQPFVLDSVRFEMS